jgi:hypothetical protein
MGWTVVTLTEREIARNLRDVSHAIAQQELEGLKVSQATTEDMQRAARGEIHSDEVIRNIYARFKNVPIFRP